jgi:hypothetical protein
MSWSVNAVGKAQAVKASLATQFESAKKNTQHIQPEAASVAYVEATVNALLDGFDPKVAVKVSASGSCMARDGVLGSASTSVQFDTLYGFCE